jgi:hypothetical protein
MSARISALAVAFQTSIVSAAISVRVSSGLIEALDPARKARQATVDARNAAASEKERQREEAAERAAAAAARKAKQSK